MESNANLNLQRSVRATEATLVYHTVKHHESFNSLDCTAPLCKSIYPDSKIAKDVTCSRSKAEAILKNVLGPFAQENMLKEVSKIRYLSVSTDSSNHGAIKLFPVLIQYFNPEKGGIQVKLLELQALPNETAETISTYIHTILTDKNLLDKLIAFSADNTNTNFGGRERSGTNSVYSRLKSATQNDDMVGVGCIAHIFSNSVHHAIESLPICVDSIVMQMHNHFASFTVRTEALKKVCSELEIDFKRMLSHSKTRWLSLYPAIERILQMYEPLKSYFLSLSYPARTLQMFFENDFSECYLWLLHSFMSIYQSRIKHAETADISVNEVIDQCSQVVENINERLEQNFCPMKVTEILRRLSEARRDEVEDFKQNMRRIGDPAAEQSATWSSYGNSSTMNPIGSPQKGAPQVMKVEEGMASISVSARIPEFWREMPRLWFAQFEATIAPQKQGDECRFQLVVSKLNREALQQVADIIYSPPETNKYQVLKERLLQVYEESPERQFQRLVGELDLGTQKPSQLLRRMKELARNSKASDETVKNLWITRLPVPVKTVLAASQDQQVDNLAAIADKVMENMQPITGETAARSIQLKRQTDQGRLAKAEPS
ncbi:uncharacterized protein LOC123879843 [Maniola jurtina]|uniref:uncharacterized protein LOC123879843 n=1 Tax=Maniola jurtina TaxID=191418 RepID=UPI001E68A1DB|nr:uncharacterized protein LOC123879843 [Maniola jurtina]